MRSPEGLGSSPLPPFDVQSGSRRVLNPFSVPYDPSQRPQNTPSRWRSSPDNSRQNIPSDLYLPHRSGTLYRDDYPNVYRPVYPIDRFQSYSGRSPSPERYDFVRSPETNHWERPISWITSSSTSYHDRRPLPASPPLTAWDRGRRDTMLATRMFEPSDSWKQIHADRPFHSESLRRSPSGYYSDHRIRDFRDISPADRTWRSDRSPIYPPGGDRYRPSYRESYMYDSYRPQHEDARREPESYRREHSSPFLRSRNHLAVSTRRSSPNKSPSRSISPRPSARSPLLTSRQSSHRDASRGRRSVSMRSVLSTSKPPRSSLDSEEPPRKKFKSRSSSHSSIASTHISDNRQSPTNSIISDALAVSPAPVTRVNVSGNTGVSTKNTLHTSILNIDRDEILLSIPTRSPPSLLQGAPKNDNETTRNTSIEVPMSNVTKSGISDTDSTPFGSTLGDSPLFHVFTNPIPECHQDAPLFETSPLPKQTCAIQLPHQEQAIRDQTPSLNNFSQAYVPISSYSESTDKDQTTPTQDFCILDVKDEDALEDIPNISEAKSLTEALRIVVRTRRLCDYQTQERRVNPILTSNLSIATMCFNQHSASADQLIHSITEGVHLDVRMAKFDQLKETLVERFARRQTSLTTKIQRLRDEYITLHEQWLANCSTLEDQTKYVAPEVESIPPSGRTTRRSAASLGDAVRSDLEMEQIIASLGNDDLTDPSQLSKRNLAVIPDMICVTLGQIDYTYNDTNHLVDNPHEYFGPYTGIHDWTEREKEIFLDKFAAFPKQFGVIAEYLPDKTTAQCVDFYYLHKKRLIDFRKVVSQYAPNKRRRRRPDKQKGNGLLADIRQHDAEVSRDSISLSFNGNATRRRRAMPPPSTEAGKANSSRRSASNLEVTPTSTPTPEPESRPRRRRANISIVRSLLDEGVADGDSKRVKRGRKNQNRQVKVARAISADDNPSTPTGESKITDEFTTRRKHPAANLNWSDEDKSLFLGLLSQHGDDFKRIAASMPNKTTIQVSNYYKTNVVDLDLAKIAASAPKRSPTPGPPRESWKDIPQYPGSGIMLPDSVGTMSPMPSLHLESVPTKSHVDTTYTQQDQEQEELILGDCKLLSTPWYASSIPDAPRQRNGLTNGPRSYPTVPAPQSPMNYVLPMPNGQTPSALSSSIIPPPPTSPMSLHYGQYPESQYSSQESRLSHIQLSLPISEPSNNHRYLFARGQTENPYPLVSEPRSSG